MKRRTKILIGISVAASLAAFLLWWASPFMQAPPFPVPDAATWVRYKGVDYPGPGGEEWTKFSLPIDDCIAAAEAIVKHDHSQAMIRRIEISENSPVPKMDGPWWFTPHSINKGILLLPDTLCPSPTTVWIDSENGIVYEHMSD